MTAVNGTGAVTANTVWTVSSMCASATNWTRARETTGIHARRASIVRIERPRSKRKRSTTSSRART